jgi:capsular exopolysaccharide synthesis family protein
VLEKLPTKVLRLSEFKRLMSDTPELRQAYSTLYAGLRLNVSFGSGKSILVTSSRPKEGKTTIASCLAITASLSGQTALLIDGDLRRPWIGSAMGIADGIGLGEVLEGEAAPAEAIHSVELFDGTRATGTLSVMSAGRKSPAFLPAVNWPKAREIFRSISEQFGMVILDSPPVLAASDALLFAGVVDAVLLVVRAGNADRSEVLRVKEQLEPIGTPVIGAVLNSFDPKKHGHSHHPHGGYYHDPGLEG